ncbi:SDR family NAD(P)-dependent oxidoreductase [Sporomusa sp. KB1]|jgi:3-oxoacyl-[acyl-carrier protein] reductase|uniref:SDR family NAD(P)-dependent oxidoreductase n=1 Tax=Sporomusa sp. KB1 TaxID=943346 RepID=UPI0011A34169|nr:SDR family NAD(P)-dependent oxidoreductase [Sporomusa sp. KB1]TWH47640.1 3-oxoacyl-[acyl-carrier protein] reductase [Sporomusa sp. KB1]
MKLAGKTVLITGASSGIGKAQALMLAKEGAQIIAADINQTGLDSVVEEIKQQGGEALGCKCAVNDSSQVNELVAAGLAAFGKIDILCNTAGIFDNYRTSLETSEEDWQKMFDINVNGVFLLTNAVLPGMLAAGKGTIINVASIAGITAGPGGTAYVASKHAVVGYTKQLCLEYAEQGIRVNAIAPGSVATPLIKQSLENDPDGYSKRVSLIPVKQLGNPDDIAKLTLFLASDDSSWIHGTVVSCDGGRFAKG